MNFKYPKWHYQAKQTIPAQPTSSSAKTGLPPGSLVHIGEIHHAQSTITLTQYNSDQLTTHQWDKLGNLDTADDPTRITWINIDGLSDTRVIDEIGTYFNIHPLVLEDILSTNQRPKLEDYEDYIYIVIRAVSTLEKQDQYMANYQQISLLLLEHCVITFREKSADNFIPLYNRLHNSKSRLRLSGADYLAYAILDTLTDEYFFAEDHLDDIIEPLEEALLDGCQKDTLVIIQNLRTQIMNMRRNVFPLNEVLGEIQHIESPLIRQKTLIYFADIHDHVNRLTDSLEIYRDRIASIQDIYLSSINNKMNETMKILTMFSTIFIPLTFIAGIYGMNFDYMPELRWNFGYPMIWMIFVAVSAILLYFFKKKKWF